MVRLFNRGRIEMSVDPYCGPWRGQAFRVGHSASSFFQGIYKHCLSVQLRKRATDS
jgi:hypothetical protein